MSWTRTKDQEQPGKFAFVCYDWNGQVFRAQGGFDTYQDAERAAEQAERQMTFSHLTPQQPVDDEFFDMTDDELLAYLQA